jgi:quercetin dioxygenase-like cupin family protein
VTRGPVWGAESEDLNATILVWPAGEGPPAHVNAERDVLYVVLAGRARLDVDGDVTELDAGAAVIVEKGRSRALAAGTDGVRYLTAHIRRSALQIGRLG